MNEILVHAEGVVSGANVYVDLLKDRIRIRWSRGQLADREIPIAQIQSVQYSTMGKVPFIRFVTQGMKPEASFWEVIRGDKDTVLFDASQRPVFEQIRKYILQNGEFTIDTGRTKADSAAGGPKATPPLTEYQRRKIYHEEKARIEAEERIKRERERPSDGKVLGSTVKVENVPEAAPTTVPVAVKTEEPLSAAGRMGHWWGSLSRPTRRWLLVLGALLIVGIMTRPLLLCLYGTGLCPSARRIPSPMHSWFLESDWARCALG
jgi:hypothetical protein